MEALRAAVATVAQYDEWDLALPHITFGLNTHVSTVTKVSPFEFAHGFPARVPLTCGEPSAQAPPDDVSDMGATAISNQMKIRHWAAADHLTAAQARLGHLLAKRSRPAKLNVRDLVWLDCRHTPNDIPFKLTASLFGPFTVLQVKGAQATLDLPSTFGKAHHQVNISRLKIFESLDSKLGPANVCPQPLWGHDGVPQYELKRICNALCHKGVDELWVEWQGYDQSQNGWVTRSSLIQDVPHLVHAFVYTWYMRLNLTHQCSSLATALLSVRPQQCVSVGCHHLHQLCQSRHFTLVKFRVLWLFENPIVWEWSCLVSSHNIRRHCWLQTVSPTSLGGLQLVAANVEREWLCQDSLPCVRVHLGGGVDRERQKTLFLVEG